MRSVYLASYIGIVAAQIAEKVIGGDEHEVELDEMTDNNDDQSNRPRKCWLMLPEPWCTIVSSTLCMAVPITAGAFFFHYHEDEDLSWVDAFYMACVTLTTVGYGDISPQSEQGRIFAVFWLLIGLTFAGRAISSLAALFTDMAAKRKKVRNFKRAITFKGATPFALTTGSIHSS